MICSATRNSLRSLSTVGPTLFYIEARPARCGQEQLLDASHTQPGVRAHGLAGNSAYSLPRQ